jgi:hypothetical protein
MKRVGPAAGAKPRFRADKLRRGAGGTSAPQDTLPQSQVASTAADDENRRLLRGARDIVLGDGDATAAVAGALGIARQPGLWKAFLAPAATYAIPPMLRGASGRWSTPDAQEAQSVMYQGPTGGFSPWAAAVAFQAIRVDSRVAASPAGASKNMALTIPSPRRNLYLAAAYGLGTAAAAGFVLNIASMFSLLSVPSWMRPAASGAFVIGSAFWAFSARTRREFWWYLTLGIGWLLFLARDFISPSRWPVVASLGEIGGVIAVIVALYFSALAASEKHARAAKKDKWSGRRDRQAEARAASLGRGGVQR